MSKQFSDSDLDLMSKEPHRHVYVETLNSKRQMPFNSGFNQREFACSECGYVRIVAIRNGQVSEMSEASKP